MCHVEAVNALKVQLIAAVCGFTGQGHALNCGILMGFQDLYEGDLEVRF